MNKKGIIYGINGPVIYLKGNTGLRMSEMVHVGEEHLVGEVISLSKKATTVQVFEETTGLKPGAEVVGTGDAISVTLGPGILNNIFDGIERPLSEIAARSGKYITRGVSVDSLDTSKKWNVHVTVSEGDHVTGGTVIAETQETASILHQIHGSSGCGGNRYQSSTLMVLTRSWIRSSHWNLPTEPQRNSPCARNGRSVFPVRPKDVSRHPSH